MSRRVYCGSGILFAHRDEGSGWEVLLFRRAIRPQKGYWSIVGGRTKRHEDSWDGALREASEEACGRRGVDLHLEEYLHDEFGRAHAWRERPYRISIPPIFEWHTFLVELHKRVPPPHFRLNWENTDADWFGVDDLPALTHRGVIGAIGHFGLGE